MLPVATLTKRLPPVTRLAIGSLTVSPLQAALPLDEAADVLAYAFDRGINLVDTAQYYRNYPILREALRRCAAPEKVMISTKTYAYSKEGAMEALEQARRELNRDVIDILMLHEQESIHTLRGHKDALWTLLEQRERGLIRAVGVSCHHTACVEGVLTLLEEGVRLDVIHPLYNRAGIGIADGGEADMARVLHKAHRQGIGIFAMKALAGGHLCGDASGALAFVLEKPFIDACAIGMQSRAEVDANLSFFETGAFSPAALERLKQKRRVLHVEEYCEGCGACMRRCPNGAITLVEGRLAKESPTEEESQSNPCDFSAEFAAAFGVESREDEATKKRRASVDSGRCVLCGYCTAVCPVFALKVY